MVRVRGQWLSCVHTPQEAPYTLSSEQHVMDMQMRKWPLLWDASTDKKFLWVCWAPLTKSGPSPATFGDCGQRPRPGGGGSASPDQRS